MQFYFHCTIYCIHTYIQNCFIERMINENPMLPSLQRWFWALANFWVDIPYTRNLTWRILEDLNWTCLFFLGTPSLNRNESFFSFFPEFPEFQEFSRISHFFNFYFKYLFDVHFGILYHSRLTSWMVDQIRIKPHMFVRVGTWQYIHVINVWAHLYKYPPPHSTP